MEKKYISNKPITPRLFSNDLLEKLSHVHPVTPLVIYVPVVIYLWYRAVVINQLSIGTILGLFGSGVVLWTLMEYVIHRFVFHYEPKSEWGKQLHFMFHGIHHDYPRDPLRLVMPPSASIPLAIVVYAMLFWTIGATFAPAVFSGVLVGYLFYDMIHYAAHHFSLRKSKIGLWLKQYHLRHHYQDDEHAFGVSNPLWDFVFGTNPPRPVKKNKEKETAASS